MVKKIETEIPGVWIIEPRVFSDDRGFFFESYNQSVFAEIGITDPFVQDNHSRSIKGTLRGLHYQLRNPQAKLCRVIQGEVLDVVVDIRIGSPHFGKHLALLLSAENKRQIYIPEGFAHGFVVTSESAEFLYKCSAFYDREDEGGILWNDPELAIDWNIKSPILSVKDQNNLTLSKTAENRLPVFRS
jgi:dTDP-4-dehydrorhamnose 3,5-epimerase